MRMKLYLMFALALIVLGGTALAQDEYPKAELFGGFSYMRTAGNSNVNGWNAQLAYNANKWFAIAADIAGHYQSSRDADASTGVAARPSASMHSFLFGPQVSDRSGRATGFAHILFGAARGSAGFNTGKGGLPADHTGFSLLAGGGVDVSVNEVIGVRVFSVDYQLIRVPGVTGDQEGRNNFRLSFGIVFKIK